MQTFQDQAAVITGGASGIGKCLAERLVQAGARVLIADIDAQRLQTVADEIQTRYGVQVQTQVVDVSREESVRELADQAYAKLGAVHLLFNNAGVGLGEAQRKIWDLPVSDWRWGMDVNFMGVVHGVHAFVPRMLADANRTGHAACIINTSSNNGGLRTIPNTPIYAASKAAVTSLSEALYQQLLREGDKLRVAVLFPGPHVVNTGILASKRNRPDAYGGADAKGVAYQNMEDLIAATGLKMQLTEPDEVAQFALQGVLENRFWLLPESADADQHIESRSASMKARGNPPSAW